MEGRDTVPDCFDTFSEYVEFCVDYRAKLAQVVKLTAVWLPQQVSVYGASVHTVWVLHHFSCNLPDHVLAHRSVS